MDKVRRPIADELVGTGLPTIVGIGVRGGAGVAFSACVGLSVAGVAGVLAVRAPTPATSTPNVAAKTGSDLSSDVVLIPRDAYAAKMAASDVAENPTAFCKL